MRKSHPVIVYGKYQSWLDDNPDVFVYTRKLDRDLLVVIGSFSAREVSLDLPEELRVSGSCLISNEQPIEALSETIVLKPYEAFAILHQMP